MELAEELCKITAYDQPFACNALAMAQAETGQFHKAVFAAQKVLEMALRNAPGKLTAGLKKGSNYIGPCNPFDRIWMVKMNCKKSLVANTSSVTDKHRSAFKTEGRR
ncbi:MAG: hypothetical protein ABIK98_12740 [Pseudomonadota bacterium]